MLSSLINVAEFVMLPDIPTEIDFQGNSARSYEKIRLIKVKITIF